MAQFVEDLSVYFAGEFSEICSIDGVDVSGLFDEPYLADEEIEGSAPSFSCPTASLPAGVGDGSDVVRSSTAVAYTVKGPPRPTGDGVTVLRLYKA